MRKCGCSEGIGDVDAVAAGDFAEQGAFVAGETFRAAGIDE